MARMLHCEGNSKLLVVEDFEKLLGGGVRDGVGDFGTGAGDR
jgi:hypothetical protein